MAGAVTITTLNDTYVANEVEKNIQYELRPHRGFLERLRKYSPDNSNAVSFNTLDDMGTTDVQGSAGTGITEGTTDLISSPSAVATTGVVATAKVYGVAALVSDLVNSISFLDASMTAQGAIARSAAERFDVDAQATIDDGSNSTGGATANSVARLLTVISALEARDVGSQGEQLTSIIHTNQLAGLRSDGVSTTATFMNGPEGGGVQEALSYKPTGYVTTLFGVDINHSTSISSSGGAYLGWVMARESAVGCVVLNRKAGAAGTWLESVEWQRDASKVAQEIIVTSAYGFGLIDNNRLQLWKSS